MSSLSAGSIIYNVLTNDTTVMKLATKVFPVAAEKAVLPYVAYRRSGFAHDATKQPKGADTVTIDVNCYAATYAESISLAESVRDALDYCEKTVGETTMRSCVLVESQEFWSDDAFCQTLRFRIRI